MRVAVNVSAIVLVDATCPTAIAETLDRHALTPDNLVVEVTEDAVMRDPRRAIAILERIKASGVEISVDDFGTGQSSLEQLKNVPADELKLDRSFVLGMVDDPQDAAIVGRSSAWVARLACAWSPRASRRPRSGSGWLSWAATSPRASGWRGQCPRRSSSAGRASRAIARG